MQMPTVGWEWRGGPQTLEDWRELDATLNEADCEDASAANASAPRLGPRDAVPEPELNLPIPHTRCWATVGGEETLCVAVAGARAIRETAKAVLVVLGPRLRECWTAKSQLATSSEIQGEGDRGTLVVSLWLAQQQGWGPPTPRS